MERVYSRLDLLEEEMSAFEDNGFIDRFLSTLLKSRKVSLTLRLPSSSIIRAKVLCEDVSIIGNLEKAFTISDLISLLYDQFLLEVRNGEGLDQLYNRVLVRTTSLPIVRTATGIYKDVDKKRMGCVPIKLDRNEALRGEVLLDDMAELYPDHDFSLERLLELITYDFINEIPKKTNRLIVKQVLQNCECN
ncbi:hypothetical protein [Pseudalkalibacillus hwajinpoensis]|uniref:hypothetical protein n=1 Tax=Guptibacillus hwajinpoensis TaxID=208199 RepID=UPI001A7E94E4|nr:hypothetical protein [Pseudalkalibacillus hwajinpoensis]